MYKRVIFIIKATLKPTQTAKESYYCKLWAWGIFPFTQIIYVTYLNEHWKQLSFSSWYDLVTLTFQETPSTSQDQPTDWC